MSGVICPWCENENRPSSNYCDSCGRSSRGSLPCEACGAANPLGHRYCDACGVALADAAAPEPVPAGESPLAATTETPAVTTSGRTTPTFPSPGAVVSQVGLALSSRLDWVSPPGAATIALVLIVAFALALRLASLRDVPSNVTADEADNLQVVYRILSDTGPGFFGLDWKPAPAYSTYVISAFMRVFGTTIVGMRMASVVLTTASLVAFYFVARPAMSKRASLASTFLLATGLWYLHFSRSGWENAHVGLYALMAILTLGLAVKRGQWYLYAAAGLFAALGLYGYASGRVIILAAAVYLPIALVHYPGERRRILRGYALLAAITFVLFAPQLETALDDWSRFNYRADAVSIFNTGGEYRGDEGLPSILVHQVWRTIDGFFLMDSGFARVGLNTRYLPAGWAILDRLTMVLFWLGLIVSVGRWRQTALWWTMLLVLVFPAQVLSTGTPDAARAVGAAPFFFLFVGLGLDWLLRLRLARREVVQTAVAVLVVTIAYINISGYFRWMDQPYASAARQPAVEVDEFELWQSLAIAEAEAGRPTLSADKWHELREANKR